MAFAFWYGTMGVVSCGDSCLQTESIERGCDLFIRVANRHLPHHFDRIQSLSVYRRQDSQTRQAWSKWPWVGRSDPRKS